MYRPLPDYLTIRESSRDGLGLYATAPIAKGTVIGPTHYDFKSIMKQPIQIPLGGFINHSDTPNCRKECLAQGYDTYYVYMLVANQDIETGEELTLFTK